MPYSLAPDAQTGLIRITHSGVVTAEEIGAADDDALNSPAYRRGDGKLLHILAKGADISAIDFDALAADLAPLVRSTAERRGWCRVAWVVEEAWNRPMFEVWRHLGAWEGYLEFDVFEDEAAARAWLLEKPARLGRMSPKGVSGHS